ncbi:MAG: crosslink repair DNA glycosylase YcaQ family protein, partial [Dehalococcoidales bacterium]|nr:crosslink repair DNA glycosylase YcaQ family protein [Dehalococcoidales bacterium]
KHLSREQALAKLAFKYFSSHGPARVEDFSWWSGLAVKDARVALDHVRADLQTMTRNDIIYWYSTNIKQIIPKPPAALLLSIYDEYTIAYKDRSDISSVREIERMISMGNALTAVIILNGKVAGSWRKSLKKNTIKIKLSPFRKLTEDEQEALMAEIARYSRFTGIPVVMD